MLRWPIRLASVVASAVVAYGWGDFARDPSPAGVVMLGLLTAVLVVALIHLYRPGGMAAFQFEDDARLAPGEAVPVQPTRPAPAAVAAPAPGPAPPGPPPRPAEPRAAEPRARRQSGGGLFGRRGEPREAPAAEPPRPPAPSPPPVPPRARRQSGGSLWSSERAPEPSGGRGGATAPASGALDLNAATVDELAMLPGIGRGAAARIVAHREARGPFPSVGALAEVEGFDGGRVNRVAGRLRV